MGKQQLLCTMKPQYIHVPRASLTSHEPAAAVRAAMDSAAEPVHLQPKLCPKRELKKRPSASPVLAPNKPGAQQHPEHQHHPSAGGTEQGAGHSGSSTQMDAQLPALLTHHKGRRFWKTFVPLLDVMML